MLYVSFLQPFADFLFTVCFHYVNNFLIFTFHEAFSESENRTPRPIKTSNVRLFGNQSLVTVLYNFYKVCRDIWSGIYWSSAWRSAYWPLGVRGWSETVPLWLSTFSKTFNSSMYPVFNIYYRRGGDHGAKYRLLEDAIWTFCDICSDVVRYDELHYIIYLQTFWIWMNTQF